MLTGLEAIFFYLFAFLTVAAAFMVIAALAWSIKQWFALSLPVSPRWHERHQRIQRDILAMERKLGVNEKLALYLLERKAANIIARASITPEASLIERARYAGKVGPNKRRTILTYTATGLLLALILAG